MSRYYAPCGTPNARRRHARQNEQCDTCGPILPRTPPKPCGTRAAAKRHKNRGETCTTCPTIGDKQPIQPCGTPAAYRRHLKNGETICDPCRKAYKASNQERRRKRSTRTYTGTPVEALIEDITFLVNAGEGTGRILAATGYTGREEALRERLRLHGHRDLSLRIFTPWELAA